MVGNRMDAPIGTGPEVAGAAADRFHPSVDDPVPQPAASRLQVFLMPFRTILFDGRWTAKAGNRGGWAATRFDW